MVQSQELNTLLEQDMSNLTTLYGEEALTYRSFSSIDDIDVELHLPLDFFDVRLFCCSQNLCYNFSVNMFS